VPQMLKAALLGAGVDEAKIEIVVDEQQANARGLEVAASGDLLLVLADNVKRSWKQIIYFDSDKKHEAPPTPGESARRPLPSAPASRWTTAWRSSAMNAACGWPHAPRTVIRLDSNREL
jgi:hypothetical protein